MILTEKNMIYQKAKIFLNPKHNLLHLEKMLQKIWLVKVFQEDQNQPLKYQKIHGEIIEKSIVLYMEPRQ